MNGIEGIERNPVIITRDKYTAVERKIGAFASPEYLNVKRERMPKGFSGHYRRAERDMLEKTSLAVATALNETGPENQLKVLTETLTGDSVGYWAEVLTLRTLRKSSDFENCTVSYTPINFDVRKPGVDIRVRTGKTDGEQFYFDLYAGIWRDEFMEKVISLVDYRAKYWFLLPLCLEADGLPNDIKRILKNYPGLDSGELKRLVATLLLSIAAEGKFPDEIITPELEQAVKSRLLAGYLIMREWPQSNLREILLLEQILRGNSIP